jgi:hypothetical protein
MLDSDEEMMEIDSRAECPTLDERLFLLRSSHAMIVRGDEMKEPDEDQSDRFIAGEHSSREARRLGSSDSERPSRVWLGWSSIDALHT